MDSQPTSGNAPSEHSFTDKELDDDLGLYYFEARWYDSSIGQFSSRDPIDGVSYVYAANNPISFVDPLGLYVMETGEVEEGDTLGDITNQLNENYGTSYTYNDIAEINGVSDPNSIAIGQIIRIGTIDADGNIWQPPTNPDVVDEAYWGSLSEFQQQIMHYGRNLYQGDLPATQADADTAGWGGPNNIPTHNLAGASGNVDYRGPNGEQAIYDTAGNIVTSPENMGTYDFEPPGSWFSNLFDHIDLDVDPWVQWGNSPQDTTTSEERGGTSIFY